MDHVLASHVNVRFGSKADVGSEWEAHITCASLAEAVALEPGMKLGVLTSIAHNLADSVACGLGFMIGVYQMDVFGEAAATPEGYIEVDFLTGATSGGTPSPGLAWRKR